MAAHSQRKALRRAERARYESMSIEELEAICAADPDPEFDAALALLTDAELEMALDDLLTRDQIIGIAAGRKSHPKDQP